MNPGFRKPLSGIADASEKGITEGECIPNDVSDPDGSIIIIKVFFGV